jgi:transcriptional regulator with XRE-family HTH domain
MMSGTVPFQQAALAIHALTCSQNCEPTYQVGRISMRPGGRWMSIGARIRDQREARKMSQVELAKQVGLSSTAIWNWEAKGRVPRPQILARVAEALSVSVHYLATGRGRPDLSQFRTTNAIQHAPEGSPMQGAGQRATVAEVLERTRMRIAELTGFRPDQIQLTLTTMF